MAHPGKQRQKQSTRRRPRAKVLTKHPARLPGIAETKRSGSSFASLAMIEAEAAGLLDGDKTEHVSFRAPKALVEAARRETGFTSNTELGTAALAVMAQPDATGAFMKKTRGRLGPDHDLDY